MMNLELRSVLCIPLHIRNEEIGVIYTDSQSGLREFDKIELTFFNALASQLARAIEKSKLYEQELEKERITKELELASEIQLNLLPDKAPLIEGLEIIGFMQPAKEIGGDYYDYIFSPDKNKLYIAIGDVSGKGIPAGLITTMVKPTLQLLINSHISTCDILKQVNNIIYQNTDSTKFMTFLLLCWDIKQQKLYYTGAGHEHLIIYHNSKNLEIIKTGGIALGIVENVGDMLQEKELKLDVDNTLILYTDGVTEARNANTEILTLENWCEIIKKSFSASMHSPKPQFILDNLINELREYMGKTPQYDDITLLAIKRVKT